MFTKDSYLVEDTNPSLDSLNNLLGALAPGKHEGIIVAEPDIIIHLSANIPNDPSFPSLWGQNNTGQEGGVADADIDAPEAWDITTGSNNVVVAVIDSGIDYNHIDLADNMWINPGEIPNNGIDDDGNGFVDDIYGWDFNNDDSDPFDDSEVGHGTHCAGTIGAIGNNAEGVSGVSWDVSLMALKLFDAEGFGSLSIAADCIDYSILMGADLSSNSWGATTDLAVLRRPLRRARDNGVLVVAAAGNDADNTDLTGAEYPAAYDFNNIISVAATNRTDGLALFSNFGATTVDLGAPGTEILSTLPGNNYGLLDGTSMATPHVSGVCALILSRDPDLAYQEVIERVLETVDPLPSLNGVTVTGGRLNAYDAVRSIGQPVIKVLDAVIDDDNAGSTSGNGDGIINPGETIGITVTLKNIGTENVSNLVSSLSLDGSSNAFTILNSSINVGKLNSGNQTTLSGQFLIEIANNAPTPTFGTFVVTTQDGSTPPELWQYEFDLGIFINSTIKGKVFAEDNSAPIRNAVVSYSGPVSGSVTTKANGSYTLDVLSGSYTLAVTADGFFDSDPRVVNVPPNKNGIDFFLERPNLVVSPSAISATLNVGDQDSRTITLSNPGTEALNWDASILQADSLNSIAPNQGAFGNFDQTTFPIHSDSSSVPVSTESLADLNGKKIMVFFSSTILYNDIFTFLESQGATVIEGEFPITAQGLEGVSVLTFDRAIYSNDPDFIPGAGPEDIAVIREWVANGGGLLLTAEDPDALPTINAVLEGTGITAISGDLDLVTLTNILPHPITEGVSAIYTGLEAYYQVSGLAHTIVFDNLNRPNTVVSKFGAGRIVATSDKILEDSNFSPPSGDGRLYTSQAIQWLAVATQLIDISPLSGTIPPGGTQELTFNLDSSTLDAGVYDVDIVFDWDDPNDTATSLVTLPVELTTLGSPEISASSPSLDFGSVIRGSSETAQIFITNDGTDILNIQNITSNRDEFIVDSFISFELVPGQSRVISVTFSASSFGSSNGVLTIQSDASNSSNLTIPLSGQGVVGPISTFDWDVISSPQNVGQPFNVSITAKDLFGNVVTDFNSAVDLNAYTGELFTTNTILDSPDRTFGVRPNISGNRTRGYSFTPDQDLVVTDFRHYSGDKVSIWEENGSLITSTSITGESRVWNETPLPNAILLRAGTTYRIAYYALGSSEEYFNEDLTSTFPHGIINNYYEGPEDAFPTRISPEGAKWLVGLRYEVLTGTPVAVSPASSAAFTSGTWTGDVTVLEAASSVQLGAREPNSGATGFSQSFNVQGSGANLPPTVAFNPASELDKVEGYDGIYIEADASDPDGSIANVKLFLDDALISTDKKSPYNWFGSKDPELVGLAPGTYELKLVATDNDGATAQAVTNLTVTSLTGNQSPTVTFNPASELDKVEGYDGIYIEADASDSDGSIDNVRLFLDGVSIRSDKKAPYNWFGSKDPELVGLAPGTYELKLVATDNEGATAEAVTNLTVTALTGNQPPVVAFNDFSTLTLVEGYTSIYIEADASDPDGTVDNVKLFLDGALVGRDRTPQYIWNEISYPDELLGLAAGTYELTLLAKDNEGATTQVITTLTVVGAAGNQPPAVAFNPLSELTVVEGYTTIYLEADASDPDGTIDNVRLFLDGVLVGRDRKAPYLWRGGKYPDVLLGLAAGTYELTLIATDNEGAVAQVVANLVVESAQPGVPVIYEAEGPEATTSESIRNDANGFSGTGFVKFNNNGNGFIEWTVEASENLEAEINFAYALSSGDKPLRVIVNSEEVASSLSFPATGGRNTWLETPALRVNLVSGSNTIRIEDIGSGGANIDYLKVVPVSTASPQP
ncbi:MAG: S8 family serine peptidase [Verrucomicrobiota bacterium]